MNKYPKKILIVRTDRIGDVILSTPVITNLRKASPSAHIAFICQPYTKDILEGNPYLDEIILYDKNGIHKSFISTIKFAFSLRKKKFDWAIILHPTNRAHLIAFLAGITDRIGWDRKMSWLLTKKIGHKKQEGRKHELEYTLDILRALNIPITDKRAYFPINETAERKVEALMVNYGLQIGEKFIVIHPGASCSSKRWPQENFSQLVKFLKEKTRYKIVIIAFQKDKESGEKIVKENDVIDLRGELTLAQTGALLKKAALFISNDSGPVHIAASLNIPVISIFGRKNPGLSPERWRPLGENSFYFHKDIGCIQCLAHNCQKEFLCLKEITPQEIVEKAITIIKK